MSLTAICCELLEHIITSKIRKHLSQNKILHDSQHGFRSKRSCETQLVINIQDLAKSLTDGNQIDIILLDFSKAFDKVPHQRLIHKLNIPIPNVAEKNILILVEEKKKSDSEFLSYNLMLNSGKKLIF